MSNQPDTTKQGKKFKVDQKVQHDFSKTTGYIVAIRSNEKGYNYAVEWINGKKDWYKEEVLEAVS